MSYLFGTHAVESVIQRSPERVRALYVQQSRDRNHTELVAQARSAGIRVEFVKRSWLDRRVQGAHQGVVADCHELGLADESALESIWTDLSSPRLLLVLDGVQDPRNLGACLRTARAAGVQVVLLPKRHSAPLNAAALKTAAGAAEGLFIVAVSNLARRLDWLKQQGAWLTGAAGDADTCYHDVDFSGDAVIVIGGEERGLRRLTREKCDQLARIPMVDGVESLNLSVAAGILLFEVVRQRSVMTV